MALEVSSAMRAWRFRTVNVCKHLGFLGNKFPEHGMFSAEVQVHVLRAAQVLSTNTAVSGEVPTCLMIFFKQVKGVICNELQQAVAPRFALDQTQVCITQHLSASHRDISSRWAHCCHGQGSRGASAKVRSRNQGLASTFDVVSKATPRRVLDATMFTFGQAISCVEVHGVCKLSVHNVSMADRAMTSKC